MSENGAPEEIRVAKDRRAVTLVWPGGERHVLPAEFLRVVSPSAEVQGHAPDQRVTVSGVREVTVADVQPVGHYAVRLVFSDGHDSGLYTWHYLRILGEEQDARWAAHLAELEAKGLPR